MPDLISLYLTGPNGKGTYTATIYTRLNTSPGGTVSFSSTNIDAGVIGNVVGAQLQTPDMQYGKLRRYDFNGDGRDDLVVQATRGTAGSYTFTAYEMISTGTTFTATTIGTANSSVYPYVYFTNWNDDACTDLVFEGTLYISGCNGTAAIQYPLSGGVVGAIDWDGDGVPSRKGPLRTLRRGDR